MYPTNHDDDTSSSSLVAVPVLAAAGRPRLRAVLAVPFSTVCFRHRPPALAGREHDPAVAAWLDGHNTRLLDAVNRTGEVFLSHTRLRDRFTIRLAVGNVRTEERHVRRAFDLLAGEGARLAAAHAPGN